MLINHNIIVVKVALGLFLMLDLIYVVFLVFEIVCQLNTYFFMLCLDTYFEILI